MNTLTLRGSLDVGLDASCGGGCGPNDRDTRALGLRCSTSSYQSIVMTGAPLRISTPGAVGASFVDLDVLDPLAAIEFLYAKSDQPMILRIGAAAARVLGVGGVFPTGFVGGESLTFTLDGTAVAVAFLAGDQTAAQVAARINAACALLGLPTPRASVDTSGQLAIEGVLTGAQGSVVVTGGTGAAALGLAGRSAVGAGADVPIYGSYLSEFPSYPSAPTRVQVSGVGSLSLVAAGRTSV